MANIHNSSFHERTLGPISELESPFLKHALKTWETIRADRLMPRRVDFDVLDLRKFMGYVALIDVEQNPVRYRFRLIGTEITTATRRDLTGRYLDECYRPEHYEILTKSFEQVIENRAPVRIQGKMFYADRDLVPVEVLDMPLSDDGETVNMVLKIMDIGSAEPGS